MRRPKDVRVVPNITDLRTLFEFSDQAWELIDLYPGLLNAQFVQVYPVAADRLKDKQLEKVILIFKTLKKRGFSVCLGVADSWNGTLPREDQEQYVRTAQRNGLTKDEFFFTSQVKAEYARGIPRRVLLELLQCSNLFVFPSRSEASPLILPEAVLAGGVLPVLNRNLSAMFENCCVGLFFPFGSIDTIYEPKNESKWYQWVTDHIIGAWRNDDALQARTRIRIKQNMDFIYRSYYAPLLAEARRMH